jgi:uncharacterized protein (TIGR00296 family)
VLSENEGGDAVRLARHSVAARLGVPGANGAPHLTGVFDQPRGAFVTWKVASNGELRGCIGYPLPVLPLRQAIEEAAVAAAVDDPRFPPVRLAELGRLLAEVSVLGIPRPIPLEQRPAAVRPGIDGVIVASGRTSGLLLPQVATEQGWDAEELLDGTCEKAGLAPGAWKRAGVEVRTFEAEVFGETAPNGAVARR